MRRRIVTRGSAAVNTWRVATRGCVVVTGMVRGLARLVLLGVRGGFRVKPKGQSHVRHVLGSQDVVKSRDGWLCNVERRVMQRKVSNVYV